MLYQEAQIEGVTQVLIQKQALHWTEWKRKDNQSISLSLRLFIVHIGECAHFDTHVGVKKTTLAQKAVDTWNTFFQLSSTLVREAHL